jgi:hypothetical protein
MVEYLPLDSRGKNQVVLPHSVGSFGNQKEKGDTGKSEKRKVTKAHERAAFKGKGNTVAEENKGSKKPLFGSL